MFAGRYGTVARVGVVVAAVALVGALIWAGTVYFQPHPDVQVVEKYLSGYRDGNLAKVQSSVSADIADALPGNQALFASGIKDSGASPQGRVKSWYVKNVDRDVYNNQSMIDVVVTTNKRTATLEFDVLELENGWFIRNVKDIANPDAPGVAGSLGPKQATPIPGHGN
jgi:hypothetical protein